MLKIIIWVVAGIVAVGSGLAIWAYTDVMKYKNTEINDVNLAELPNGVYKGTFKAGRFTNSVEVTVIDQKIAHIKQIDSANKLEDLYDQIYDEIIKKQSLRIDTISGATVSTKTALKAIENALSSKGSTKI